MPLRRSQPQAGTLAAAEPEESPVEEPGFLGRLSPHETPCQEDEGVGPHECDCTHPGLLLWLVGAGLVAAGLSMPQWAETMPDRLEPGPAMGWAVLLAGMAWLAWTFGWALRRTPVGILVTGRNVTSLSLLQAVAWSLLLLSAVVAVATWAPDGLGGALEGEGTSRPDDPLAEVGVQVGAVAGTSAAAVAITTVKKGKAPTPKALESAAKADVARRTGHHAKRMVDALRASPEQPEAQVRLVLGRLQTVGAAAEVEGPAGAAARKKRGAGDAVAASALPGRPEAVGFVEAMAKMATADEGALEPFVRELLEGRVPANWPGLVDRFGFPSIDVTRDFMKRYAQASAFGEIIRTQDGSIYHNACACQARLADMLEGDEVLDHRHKDGTKVQFLLVTLGSLAAMAIWTWHRMDVGAFGDVFLPGLPEGMTYLSAATGLGYIGGKLPQRTPVQPRFV